MNSISLLSIMLIWKPILITSKPTVISLLMLKFTHGVEVGAHLAYRGHFWRTRDEQVYKIASEEWDRQVAIKRMLKYYGTSNSAIFDVPFTVVGTCIKWFCLISPRFMLNAVASLLEMFAVFSYNKLAPRFPVFEQNLLEMAETEFQHEKYFKS